jgi:hypothetical protein
MLELVASNKVPVELSPHIRGRADFFFRFQLNGFSYYVPVSKELKNLFKLGIRKGGPIFDSFPAQVRCEALLGDIASCLYLQMRDTVGAEIKNGLHRDIEERFSSLFSKVISDKVDEQLAVRIPVLLEEQNENIR